jgi:hypothetical protein
MHLSGRCVRTVFWLGFAASATVAIGAITSSILPALLPKSTDGSVGELVMALHNGKSVENAQNLVRVRCVKEGN